MESRKGPAKSRRKVLRWPSRRAPEAGSEIGGDAYGESCVRLKSNPIGLPMHPLLDGAVVWSIIGFT